MQTLSEISKTIAGMPVEGQLIIMVVSAFGLAAYAIYAVLSITKDRR